MDKMNLNFDLNTANNCFICFREADEDLGQIPLRTLCEHLEINLAEIITVPMMLQEHLVKRGVRVKLCDVCGIATREFSDLWADLEITKIKMRDHLGVIGSRLYDADEKEEVGAEFRRQVERDLKAKLHLGSVEKLRRAILEKAAAKERGERRALKKVKYTSSAPSLNEFNFSAATPANDSSPGQREEQSEESPDKEPLSSTSAPITAMDFSTKAIIIDTKQLSDLSADENFNLQSAKSSSIGAETDVVQPSRLLSESSLSPGIDDFGKPESVNSNSTGAETEDGNQPNQTPPESSRSPVEDPGNSQSSEQLLVKEQQDASAKVTSHICDFCKSEYSTAKKLKKHIRINHPDCSRKVQCHLCEKWLASQHTLKVHIASIHENKKYPCDLCGKLMSAQSGVSLHKRKYCPKIFDQSKPSPAPAINLDVVASVVQAPDEHSVAATATSSTATSKDISGRVTGQFVKPIKLRKQKQHPAAPKTKSKVVYHTFLSTAELNEANAQARKKPKLSIEELQTVHQVKRSPRPDEVQLGIKYYCLYPCNLEFKDEEELNQHKKECHIQRSQATSSVQQPLGTAPEHLSTIILENCKMETN